MCIFGFALVESFKNISLANHLSCVRKCIQSYCKKWFYLKRIIFKIIKLKFFSFRTVSILRLEQALWHFIFLGLHIILISKILIMSLKILKIIIKCRKDLEVNWILCGDVLILRYTLPGQISNMGQGSKLSTLQRQYWLCSYRNCGLREGKPDENRAL